MRYAIFEINGHQMFTYENTILKCNFSKISWTNYVLFNKILLLRLFNQCFIGQPYIKNAPLQVIGRRLPTHTSQKVIIFKLKSKKKYRRKLGYKSILSHYLIFFKNAKS